MMRWLALLVAIAACKTGSAPTGGAADDITYHSGSLADDDYKPTYDKVELQQALVAERAAATLAESKTRELEDKGDFDQLARVSDDLKVRRRFIAALAACEALGMTCPPRLDEPAWSFDIQADADPGLDAKLLVDLDSWRKVAAELHGRACACRTLTCVDSMFVAIDRLDTRPMRDVQADEAVTVSITRARECLYRLRGLRPTPHVVDGE